MLCLYLLAPLLCGLDAGTTFICYPAVSPLQPASQTFVWFPAEPATPACQPLTRICVSDIVSVRKENGCDLAASESGGHNGTCQFDRLLRLEKSANEPRNRLSNTESLRTYLEAARHG
ncbi:hypothetical protein C8R45DRAFT_955464 [Mycena sanguinolenta]|nr:hypothetical protein C8R45DRAFT_955464 [Mycena sanguinolenta]